MFATSRFGAKKSSSLVAASHDPDDGEHAASATPIIGSARGNQAANGARADDGDEDGEGEEEEREQVAPGSPGRATRAARRLRTR